MTGPEAERAGARIAIHLRRNEFGVCREIIRALETQHDLAQSDGVDDPTPIAEVRGLDLRYVNALEKAGYIYLEDLDGVDLEELIRSGPRRISHFGTKAVTALKRAREKAVADHDDKRKEHARREFGMVGEPLLDAKDGWMRT